MHGRHVKQTQHFNTETKRQINYRKTKSVWNDVGPVVQSVHRLTTGWMVRNRTPVWDEIFSSSRPALGPTHFPVKWVPGLSWE